MSLDSPRKESTPTSRNQQPETADQAYSKEGMVVLQPVAMRIPNSHNVYSPSKLRPQKGVSYEEFLARYANHPRGIRICFDEILSPVTIFQRSALVTAYGFGLDCWYVVAACHDAKSDPSES